MNQSIAFFWYSTADDISFMLEFNGYVLTDRQYQIELQDRASATVRATLTIGDGLTIEAANLISAVRAKEDVAGWPTGEYQADLVDITDGINSTVMAVRFLYDKPGNLPYGVCDRKAFVTWTANKAYVTATGGVGPGGPKGPRGWTPVFAVVSDGERRVLQIEDWVGGEGVKPDVGDYVGASGLTPTIDHAVDIRGAAGSDGVDGWAPVLAVVADGARRVLQVNDWIGGSGTKPATGGYVGATGLTPTIGDAVDIRGPAGGALDPGDFADEAEAEAGTDNEKVMTPLRTKQAVIAHLVVAVEAAALSMPTSLPATPGKLWNNGGVLCIS